MKIDEWRTAKYSYKTNFVAHENDEDKEPEDILVYGNSEKSVMNPNRSPEFLVNIALRRAKRIR